MEKTDMDYKQRNWKIQAKFFKIFNCDAAPLRQNILKTELFEIDDVTITDWTFLGIFVQYLQQYSDYFTATKCIWHMIITSSVPLICSQSLINNNIFNEKHHLVNCVTLRDGEGIGSAFLIVKWPWLLYYLYLQIFWFVILWLSDWPILDMYTEYGESSVINSEERHRIFSRGSEAVIWTSSPTKNW